VYLIKDGQLYGFRDAKEYLSHGYNFTQVVTASAADMALSQLSGNIIGFGRHLGFGRFRRQDRLLWLAPAITKRGFATAEVFKALGYSFTNLPKINMTDYSAGPVITSATDPHPDGALVLDGKTVWWILNGTKQGFESMAVFNNLWVSHFQDCQSQTQPI